MRADILGRAIEVKDQYSANIVAEAHREIAKLSLKNAELKLHLEIWLIYDLNREDNINAL